MPRIRSSARRRPRAQHDVVLRRFQRFRHFRRGFEEDILRSIGHGRRRMRHVGVRLAIKADFFGFFEDGFVVVRGNPAERGATSGGEGNSITSVSIGQTRPIWVRGMKTRKKFFGCMGEAFRVIPKKGESFGIFPAIADDGGITVNECVTPAGKGEVRNAHHLGSGSGRSFCFPTIFSETTRIGSLVTRKVTGISWRRTAAFRSNGGEPLGNISRMRKRGVSRQNETGLAWIRRCWSR